MQDTEKLDIRQGYAQGKFEIGHSEFESKTFIPNFQKDEELNAVYADIAGL